MNRWALSFAVTAVILFTLCINSQSSAAPQLLFQTKYTQIFYSDEKDLDDFIWRLGGQHFEYSRERDLAKGRVDRVIDRVQTILGIWPGTLKISIYLHHDEPAPNKIAYYEYATRAIHVMVSKVTDGIFAHEVAHAIINQGFNALLPSKMQEILTQYVDKYLWSDY